MLNFGFFDLLCLFGVAGDAYRLRVGLRQDDLPILRRRVAAVAHLVFEWIVCEGLHQLWLRGLMWIVALNAIRVTERLAVMNLNQVRILGVMAIETKRWGSLGEVFIELNFAALTGLVRRVASLAAHIERCVPAAVLGNVHTFVMAAKAEVLVFGAAGWLQQLILVWRAVRIVTLDAIANGRRMHLSVNLSGILVGVAGDAQRLRRGGYQLYAGYVFVDANLVTARAAHLDCRVNVGALAFVFVALEALRGVCFRIERDRVLRCPRGQGHHP
jgi:hypothetical protein